MAIHVDTIDAGDASSIAEVTIDRPPVNALDIEHFELLALHVDRLARDSRLQGVVLTGSGRAFSAGVDTKAYAGYSDADRRRLFSAIDTAVARMLGLRIPVGAAVNGHALGGGLVIALAADVRCAVAGEYRLGLTEVVAGVPYPAVPMELVRREVDPTLIRRLVIAGDTIGPSEAAELRLIDAVVVGEDLLPATRERVARLAGLPAFAEVKAQFRQLGHREGHEARPQPSLP